MPPSMPREMSGLTAFLHRHLDRRGWPGPGLSPANRVIVGLIAFSCAGAILATEPALRESWFPLIRLLEWILSTVFAVEYGARLIGAGGLARYRGLAGRGRYMLSPLALLDLLAIAPFFAFGSEGAAFFLLRAMRGMVLLSFGHLGGAWRDLGAAVAARSYELGIAFLSALIALVAGAAAMFAVEGDVQPEAFGSIPRALWWSVATLTTVGYGDVYPITGAGRVVAGVLALAAIGLVALPAGILAAALSDLTRRRRAADKPDRPPPPV